MRELDFILRQTVMPKVSERCVSEGLSPMYCLQFSEVSQEKMTFAASVIAVILGVITNLICVYFLISNTLSFSFVNVVCIGGLTLGLMSCLYPIYMLTVQAFSRTTRFLQASNILRQEISAFKSDAEKTKINLVASGSGCFNAEKTIHSLSYVRIAFAAVSVVVGIGLLIAGVCLSTAYASLLSSNSIVVVSFVFAALGVLSISGGFSAFKVHMLSSEALGWLQLLVLGSCLLSESKTKDSLEKQLEEANSKLSDMMLENSKQRTQIDFLENQIRNISFTDSVKQQVGAAQLSSLQKLRKIVAQGSSSLSEILSALSHTLYPSIKREVVQEDEDRLRDSEVQKYSAKEDIVDEVDSISLDLYSVDVDPDVSETESTSSEEEFILCPEDTDEGAS
ncbi:hypothetical protein [Chlamydiifrater volucris]|uniref:hypothetical protein n=1 Tax=Chlamydiifrater volucris TaxID=2681470 RepID=UPI001BD08E2A|nr:hypothetical protein [Chlamydiifrater volucris]